MTTALVLLATVLTGLSAGLFAGFSYAVMPGLRRTDDAGFVAAMRGINVAILNPVFGAVFAGALLVAVAAPVVGLVTDDLGDAGRALVVGAALQVAMVGVTMALNVPLNDRLEASGDDPAAARVAFERPWARWNHVRSVLATGSFGAFAVALLQR